MKYILSLFLLIFISFVVAAQERYVLNVTVLNKSGGTLELKKFRPELLLEKESPAGQLLNSKYKFEGAIDNPIEAYLIFIAKDGTRLYSPYFYIDAGLQEIKLDSTTFEKSTPVFKGTPTNKQNQKYLSAWQASEQKLKWLTDSLDRLDVRYTATKDLNLKKQKAKLKQLRNDERDDFTDAYVTAHKDDYLSLWIIDSCLRERYSVKLKHAFDHLSVRVKLSKLGLAVNKTFGDVQAVLPGGYLPVLSLKDTTGNENKETFKRDGKYLFVEFWFSHCAPCLARLPELKEIYNKRDQFNIEFIGVSVRERNMQEWKTAINRYQIPWPQRFDYSGLFLNTYKIHFFPSNVIIDPTGKVVARDLEPSEVKDFLAHVGKN